MKKRKSPKKRKKKTLAQLRKACRALGGGQGLVYDTKTKECRESKRQGGRGARNWKSPKRKSPKRKSPKRKSPKRKSPKRKSPKRKSPKQKKKTQAQLRKECRAQGLVYDTKTKRCRESKRKRRKSPKRKSPKRKSPKRKSPKRKSPKRKSPKRTEEWLKSLEDKPSIFENGFDRRDDEERWMETQDSFGPDEISRTEWVKLGQSKAGGGHALTPSSDVAYEILQKFVKKKKKAKKSPTKAKKGRKSPKRKSPKRKKKKSRQGPFESATAFPVGYRLWGNDGKRWEIMSDKNGRKRWKRVSTDTL